MTESLDIHEKQQMVEALIKMQRLVTSMPVKKQCQSCEHWQEGCRLADFAIPPREVQENGCEKWEERDWIPF